MKNAHAAPPWLESRKYRFKFKTSCVCVCMLHMQLTLQSVKILGEVHEQFALFPPRWRRATVGRISQTNSKVFTALVYSLLI